MDVSVIKKAQFRESAAAMVKQIAEAAKAAEKAQVKEVCSDFSRLYWPSAYSHRHIAGLR